MKKLFVLTALALGACADGTSTGAAPPAGPPTAGGSERSKVITKGEAYKPADYLTPGSVTLLDFYADW